jgi:O-antigen/teichoic acid export membrane protein
MSDAGLDAPDVAEPTRRAIASGLAWESAARVLTQVVSWASTVVTVRLLAPDDYGLFWTAGIFILALQIFADYGLGSGLVSARALTRAQISQTFWLNMLLATALYAALFVASPHIADLYDQPNLTSVLRLCGLALFFSAMRVVPYAMSLRRLDYRFRVLCESAGQFTQAVVTPLAALSGAGYWSLVVAFVLGQLVTTVLFCVRWESISLKISGFGEIRDLVTLGASITGSRLLSFAVTSADTIIVSLLVGPKGLGVYALASQIAMVPLDKIGSVVSRVAFPAIARFQSDAGRAASFLTRAHTLLLAIAGPIPVGIALVSRDVATVLFPGEWGAIAPVLSLLCVATFMRLSALAMPPVLEGLRHGRAMVVISTASALLLVPAFWIGSHWGIVGVSAAWALAYPLVWLVTVIYTARALGVRAGRVVAGALPVVLALVAMAIVVLCVQRIVPEAGLGRLMSASIAGAITYAAIIYITVLRHELPFLRTVLRPASAPELRG